MALVLTSVRLHHDADARHGALALRIDATHPIEPPEWRLDAAGRVHSAPAAYARRDAAGQPLRLDATFERTGALPDEVEVRAIDFPASAWSAPNLLGDVSPQRVRLGAAARSGAVRFTLEGSRIGSRGVGRYAVHWRWQYRATPAAAWTDFAWTSHTVYLLLGVPTDPWQQAPEQGDDTQLPWAAVLDHACTWAAGATTPDAAAAAVTAQVYTLGLLGVIRYGCPVWAMEMYARSFAPWNHFDLTAWLERLAGGWGNGPYVNCTDCATAVSTFANALGCDLWQSRMGRYLPQFETFPILAVGAAQWQIPCGIWPAFSFHEVAWTGACGDDDTVYDACLLLDVDAMPWLAPRQAVLPVAARFGRAGEGGYRDRLATPAGRLDCVPRAAERRRRAVF
ncbi:hypothetical protein V4F39_03165 [Aquincola sp. MAHUQ-54]|uniref:Uncharacterized protein n=1 Tax=Aquincola agrisoli TaxID=3119538 RepID=A0AAW9PZE1_9BURK